MGYLIEARGDDGRTLRCRGRLPLTGTYDELRLRALAIARRAWPHLANHPPRIVWQP